MRVGFVGWRGMVGSVLMQRMLEERDFDTIDPVFFSTSSAGGKAPDIGTATGPLRDANSPEAFNGLDAVVTCQGGDWTNAMFPRLRNARFDGYWIDAASALRSMTPRFTGSRVMIASSLIRSADAASIQ